MTKKWASVASVAKRVQKVTIVKPKHKKYKKLTKVTFKPRNNKLLPDRLNAKLPIDAWGYIVAGASVGYYYICANTIITSSGAGPLVAGPGATYRLTSSVPGAMYAQNITSATYPSGFPILFAPTVGNACLYNKYVVTDIQYNIEFCPVASADDMQVCVYAEKFATTTTATTMSTLPEAFALPFAKSKIISYIHTKKENTISGTINIAKFLGITQSEVLNDPAYCGTIDTNAITYPSQIVNLIIWVNNTRNVVSTNSIPFKATFKYGVVFSSEAARMMPE